MSFSKAMETEEIDAVVLLEGSFIVRRIPCFRSDKLFSMCNPVVC